MSNELISILIALATVSVALATLSLTGNRGLRQDMSQLETRLREDMARIEARLQEDMKHLAERMARLEHSQAKLEGLLEDLREAISGRVAAG